MTKATSWISGLLLLDLHQGTLRTDPSFPVSLSVSDHSFFIPPSPKSANPKDVGVTAEHKKVDSKARINNSHTLTTELQDIEVGR